MGSSKTKLNTILDKISMILLCVLMVDVCILAHLKLFDIGLFGNRMILLILLCIVSIPKIIVNFKNLIKNKFFLMVLAFGVWMVFSAVLGIINKNSTDILVLDVKGFFYFVFIPVALCVLNSKERIHILMKSLMYATIVVSLIYIAYIIIYLVSPEIYNQLLIFGVETKFSLLGIVTSKIPRVFIANAMYLLCGFAFPLYFYATEKNLTLTKRIVYPIICGLSVFSMMITYTRSVYLGAGVTVLGCVAVLLIKASAKTVKSVFAFLLLSIVSFGIVLASFSISQKTDYLSFALTRTFVTFSTPEELIEKDQLNHHNKDNKNDEDKGIINYLEETQKSDDIRKATINELVENIKLSPMIGHGLGKGLAVRNNDGGLHEYFYLDVLSKMGIIGLILYMLPAFYMAIAVFFKKNKAFNVARIWYFVLLGFMIFSFFNPYMNASLGILMYCCTMASFEICSKLKSNCNEQL